MYWSYLSDSTFDLEQVFAWLVLISQQKNIFRSSSFFSNFLKNIFN